MRVLLATGVMLSVLTTLSAVSLPDEWQAVFPKARLVEEVPGREGELAYQFFFFNEGLAIHLRFSCISNLKLPPGKRSGIEFGSLRDPVCTVSFWSPKGETTVDLPYNENEFWRVLGFVAMSEVFFLPSEPLYLEPAPFTLGPMSNVASRRVGAEVTSIVRPYGESRTMDALMKDLWTDTYQKMELLPEPERLRIARLIAPDGAL